MASIGDVDNGLNTDIKVRFDLIEETIDDGAQVVNTDPLCVKLHSNTLVTINRLPVELLIYIILFANKPIVFWNAHPYLSYTWVCHHWRIVLIQSPVFWTLIQPPSLPERLETFYHELFARSKHSKLDVILSRNSDQPDAMQLLEKLFSESSSRIRRLRLPNDYKKLMELVLSGQNFPSLRGLAFYNNLDHDDGRCFSQLLPILAASDHLETLELILRKEGWSLIPKAQMAFIFSRLRNLSLTISGEVAQFVLDLLHDNNRKLQKLQLRLAYASSKADFSNCQAIFPELQVLFIDDDRDLGLMHRFRAPKLSSLHTSISSLDYPILKDLDFLSIKNLTVRDYCPKARWHEGVRWILGTKERIDHETLSIERTKVLFEEYSEYTRNYFHLAFKWDFVHLLKEALSLIVPRLTNLVELHLHFHHTDSLYEEILPLVPSIQELTVRPGGNLINLLHLLSNPSQCPHLTHLTYTTFPLPENREEYADNVGRSLTNCLQSRQDTSPGDALKYINLKNRPSLSDIWIEELQGLGAEVIVEKDFKNLVFCERY